MSNGDACAEERSKLRSRILQVRDDTQREMERLEREYWQSRYGDDHTAIVKAQVFNRDKGPNLPHREQIRAYEKMLQQLNMLSCKEVRKMSKKMGGKARKLEKQLVKDLSPKNKNALVSFFLSLNQRRT